MIFNLVIFDSDPEKVIALESAFGELASVTILHVDTMLYLRPPKGIDVLYLPLAAAERWGSKPLVHESQILSTSLNDQESGLPPFIVAGTCLAPNDPRGSVPEMKLLLLSVFNAIRSFNSRGKRKLRRVGFWGDNLLTGLTPHELKGILLSVVPELL